MKFTNTNLGIIAAAALVAVVAAALFVSTGGSCGDREQVEARVALVSSRLQQAASAGTLTVEQLAAGIKRMNDAATAYESNKDGQAYCEVLDKLSTEYTPD